VRVAFPLVDISLLLEVSPASDMADENGQSSNDGILDRGWAAELVAKKKREEMESLIKRACQDASNGNVNAVLLVLDEVNTDQQF
jgi:hypothetical protein